MPLIAATEPIDPSTVGKNGKTGSRWGNDWHLGFSSKISKIQRNRIVHLNWFIKVVSDCV